MPQPLDKIFEAIMQDPDFEAFPGKTREESAWATAWQRYKQSKNNEKALNISNEATVEEKFLPAVGAALGAIGRVAVPAAAAASVLDEGEEVEEMEKQYEFGVSDTATKLLQNKEVIPQRFQNTLEPAKTKQEIYVPSNQERKHSAMTNQNIAKTIDFFKSILNKSNAYQKGHVYNIEKRHWERPKNVETEDQIEKQIKNPFAVATAAAKKMGYKDFSEGSPGREKRSEIAESIKRGMKMEKSESPINKFFDYLEKGYGIKIEKQPPPGPAPRPGLQWRPQTHRWIRPQSAVRQAREKLATKGKIDNYFRTALKIPADKSVPYAFIRDIYNAQVGQVVQNRPHIGSRIGVEEVEVTKPLKDMAVYALNLP